MSNAVKPVPEGFHTITPYLVVQNADRAIAFYQEAFGAEETGRLSGPDGGPVLHADLKIGDSHLFLCDEFPDMGARGPQALGGSPVTVHLYVEDADAVFHRAVKAGASATMPPADMFWGDRYGKLTDPFGHHWSIASRIENLDEEQMKARATTAFSAEPCQG